MNTHVVTKALPVGETVYQPGDEVDASEWKHARLLVEQRYLKPLDGVVAAASQGTVAETDALCGLVADEVIRRLRESGELIQPNGREQRMGRKDKQHGDQSRN